MTNSLKIKIFVFLFILTICFFSKFTASAGQYHIIRVVDGDTVDVDHLNKKFTVRLVGIDAPELGFGNFDPSQPFAKASKKHLTELIYNRIVDMKSYGSDNYGRMLAEVFSDNKNINIEMLKVGLAEVYKGNYSAPGLDFNQYREAEDGAKRARIGIWSQARYMSPREWLKTH
jgi:micrococcal nuclease